MKNLFLIAILSLAFLSVASVRANEGSYCGYVLDISEPEEGELPFQLKMDGYYPFWTSADAKKFGAIIKQARTQNCQACIDWWNEQATKTRPADGYTVSNDCE